MAKRKKTRREKVLADTRRQSISHQIVKKSLQKQNYSSSQPNPEPQLSTYVYDATPPQAKALDYTEFTKDLRKTVIFTVIIMAVEIVAKLFI